MSTASRLGGLVRVTDLAIVFALTDAGIALFLLSADGRIVLGVVIAGAGAVLAAVAFLPLASRIRGLALAAAAVVLGAGFNAAFVSAHPPHAPFHDSALMTEAAATRLIQGQDPYGHDYLHTIARTFYTPDVAVNFGLGHYVYTPVDILLDAPLRFLARSGGPDLGFPAIYWLGLLALAAACLFLGTSWAERIAALTAVSLNPLMVADASVNFFNDVLYLAPALGSMAALRHRRPVLAGALFGLALATKQQAILFLPFLTLGLWLELGGRGVVRAAGAGLVVAGALILPFFLWNPRAFVGDVAGFFYGSGVDVYPIRGASLPGLLLLSGALPNRWVAFPSAPFQLAVTLPVLAGSLLWLRRRWSWPKVWLCLAAVTFLVFFFGRVLVPNYVDLILILVTLAATEWLAGRSVTRELSPAGTGEVRPDDGGVRRLHREEVRP